MGAAIEHFPEMKLTHHKKTNYGRDVLSRAQWQSLARSLRFSPREFQIVQRIFDSETEAYIAAGLGISVHTVHTYLERLYRKLSVNGRCELIVRVFAEHVDSLVPADPLETG